MRIYHFTVSLLALAAMVACTKLEGIEEPQDLVDNGLIQELSITGKDFLFEYATRSSVTIGENGASFAWDEDDVIGIFPDKGDQVSFAMEEGAGTQTATFTGGGWALKSSSKYAAYYPHIYENRDLTAIPVSYVSQTQNGNGNTDHIGEYDFMAAGVSTPENGAVAFDMQHLGALVQLAITVPEPSTLSKVTLTSGAKFTETGTIDLTAETPSITAKTQSNTLELILNNVTTTEANETVTVYFMTAPVDLTGNELTATVHFSDESTCDIELIGKNLKAGRAYSLTEVIPNNQIWYTADQIIAPMLNEDLETFGAKFISNDYDAEKKCGVLTFDGDVTKIGVMAFFRCTSLTSITIPNCVTTIENGAFHYCTSLTSITIPDSVTTIRNSAFLECTSLTRFDSKFASDDGRCLIIEGTLHTVAPSGLIEYTIPDSVTSIGEGAFSRCTSLRSVTIPDSITSIGDVAFSECTSLTNVSIPDSVTSIGDGAFYGCTSLARFNGKFASNDGRCLIIDGKLNAIADLGLIEYTIPNSVTYIGDSVFSSCKSLRSITIPDSVTAIGGYAFQGCTSLTSITYPNGVNTTIGEGAFQGCTSLMSITIPDSVTTIGDWAFYECTSLTNVSIPDSVTSIGYGAFYGCTSLTSITIPDSVTTIENSAFCACTILESITIPDGVTSIGSYAFERCTSLESITIPDGVTTIEDRTFWNCRSLTSITIPDGVTSIGDDAFYCCMSLTSITIPNSVTSIGNGAFQSCYSLTSVYCKPIAPPSLEGSMFSDNASGRKIYVPEESVEAYKSAPYWSDYADEIVGYEF